MEFAIVTGANGFIGSTLIKALIRRGVHVTAIDINFSKSKLPESSLITRIESAVDMSLIYKLHDKYDVFYHLAWKGVNGKEKADPYLQLDNIRMAIDCANICKKKGINKFLCAGTVAENAVYSLQDLSIISGGMMYGVAKHACRLMLETYCKHIELPFIWMQFSNIYGVGNKTGNLVSYTLEQLLKDNDATFGPAQQPYDFIYVDDLIEAVCRLGEIDSHKSFYYIGSGQPMILKDYLMRIGQIIKKDNKIMIGVRPDDGIKYSMNMFYNNDLVREVGNYVETSFIEGITKTVEWLKSEML